MAYREFHYCWEYDLESSPEALWPLVSDTNRFNRDAGVPDVEREVNDEDGGGAEAASLRNARRRLRLSLFGLAVEWEEDPFEWVRPFRFGVVRRYRSGPVEEMRVLAELKPRGPTGTRLTYQIWARPKTALGLVAIPLQIGRLSAQRFAAVFRRYDSLARAGRIPALIASGAQHSGADRARLAAVERQLLDQGAAPELTARLIELVEQGDDLTVARLRPYALADYWQEPRRAVLELCLQATRAGLLDLRWDILCPLCRGAKQTTSMLRDVKTDVHCATCQIDFTANFDASVEVTFRSNPAVRPADAREFCVGGPQNSPHVVAQQLLAPGAARTLTPTLEAGRYRLRTLNLPGGQMLSAAPDGDAEITLRAADDAAGWPGAEVRVATRPLLRLENSTGDEQLFILERTAWSDQAATAADVTALQTFRDLFASEALRPGDQISVGTLTILFTDLRASTRLYREIGDAVAFGAVMNHFDVLREAIAAEGGAMVKTLGDAVMAVFRHPADALTAMLRAQHTLAAPPPGTRPLWLKAGIHSGPCIAVTLNGRLDYFGSNVNIAARLEPLSTGRDIIISSAVHSDPRVAEMLSDSDGDLRIEPLETALKGFDTERFALWRVSKKSAESAGE